MPKELLQLAPGTLVPKPNGATDVIVKGWGVRRGEKALVFRIPGKRRDDRRWQSGVTQREWERALRRLRAAPEGLTRDWFDANLPDCSQESGGNFTTIGGVFEVLGWAAYENGAYLARERSSRAGQRQTTVEALLV